MNVEMCGGMNQIFTRKMRILTIFAIRADAGEKMECCNIYVNGFTNFFSHLCYLELTALYMYSPVDSEDVDFYSPPLRSPGCNSSPITAKLGRDVPWVKMSAGFIHGRQDLLNECLTS